MHGISAGRYRDLENLLLPGGSNWEARGLTLRQFHKSALGWRSDGRHMARSAVERLAVIVTLPIWGSVILALWLMIKVSAPRHPAVFLQERAGLNGRVFRIAKLRTMVPDAEQRKKELAKRQEGDAIFDFKLSKDPRTTKLGHILRATYLDELPQLFNVLANQMSLVGPRPNTFPVSRYRPWWRFRLMCKPGLTGPAQIHRHECNKFADRVRQDIRYVRRQSWAYDVCILVRTITQVFMRGKGI